MGPPGTDGKPGLPGTPGERGPVVLTFYAILIFFILYYTFLYLIKLKRNQFINLYLFISRVRLDRPAHLGHLV